MNPIHAWDWGVLHDGKVSKHIAQPIYSLEKIVLLYMNVPHLCCCRPEELTLAGFHKPKSSLNSLQCPPYTNYEAEVSSMLSCSYTRIYTQSAQWIWNEIFWSSQCGQLTLAYVEYTVRVSHALSWCWSSWQSVSLWFQSFKQHTSGYIGCGFAWQTQRNVFNSQLSPIFICDLYHIVSERACTVLADWFSRRLRCSWNSHP